MPTTHAAGARLTTGAIAITVAASLAAAPLATGDPGPLRPLVVAFAVLGLVAAVAGVGFAVPSLGPAAAVLLAAAFVATLADRGRALDARTPLVAAGLLLVAELVAWSAEARDAGTIVPGAGLPRSAVLAAIAAGAWAATVALAAVVTLPFGRDLAYTAAGALAVAAVTALLLGLAQRRA